MVFLLIKVLSEILFISGLPWLSTLSQDQYFHPSLCPTWAWGLHRESVTITGYDNTGKDGEDGAFRAGRPIVDSGWW